MNLPFQYRVPRFGARLSPTRLLSLMLVALLVSACASGSMTSTTAETQADEVMSEKMTETMDAASEMAEDVTDAASWMNKKELNPMDPRVGLGAGLLDAEEAVWNLNLLSFTPPPDDFVGTANTDLAFKDNYVIQGNYNGIQVWDVTDPAAPLLVKSYVCPASQSDVSVYENLLFVSGEGLGGRLDCGTEGVRDVVSADRLRGIRIFDITNIAEPEYVANVQTCRGSHTHSVLKDPDDDENVYVYVSGSASVRPAEELPGCSGAAPEEDPNTALFRIEVIKVPLANPELAAIVSSPRIFEDLVAPPEHGPTAYELEQVELARAQGGFIGMMGGHPRVMSDRFVARQLAAIVEQRGGSGSPTAADSAVLRQALPPNAGPI